MGTERARDAVTIAHALAREMYQDGDRSVVTTHGRPFFEALFSQHQVGIEIHEDFSFTLRYLGGIIAMISEPIPETLHPLDAKALLVGRIRTALAVARTRCSRGNHREDKPWY